MRYECTASCASLQIICILPNLKRLENPKLVKQVANHIHLEKS